MAQCQKSTDDREKSKQPQDDLQLGQGASLVPLSLPPGVTPEIAARLTTSILMRRAYTCTCPWTQWLLLASVGILHGQATPTLDSVHLHMLQGTLNEKLASNGNSLSDIEENENSHLGTDYASHSSCGAFLHQESVGVQATPKKLGILSSKWIQVKMPQQIEIGMQTEILTSNKERNLNRVENSLKTGQVCHEKHCLPENNLVGSGHEHHHDVENVSTSGTDYASHSSSGAFLHQESVGVQVTPKKLGILSSKWIQVKMPRRIEIGMQTETLTSNKATQVEYLETQFHGGEYADSHSKAFADKETQTIMKYKRDISSQTGNVDLGADDKPSQPLWSTILVSDVPNRKEFCEPAKKSKMKNSDQKESDNLGKGPEGSSKENFTLNERQLFHGRPMFEDKKTKPVEIPLDSVLSVLDSAQQDPRLVSKSDCL